MWVAPSFLSDKEVDEILALTEGRWYPSLVDAYGTGEAVRSILDRSSFQCSLEWAESPLVEEIEARLAMLSGMKVRCAKPRYQAPFNQASETTGPQLLKAENSAAFA